MIASLGCHQKISWSLMFHFYDQDRDACNNGMHAGMSLPHKLQCAGQSEEKFPTQKRTEA